MIERWQLGDVEMIRVEEMSGGLTTGEQWFRDFDLAELDPFLDWLAPDFFNPKTHAIQTSVHSFILRVDGKTIVIDTCTGNHKLRPGWSLFDNLDLPYLERLARAGVDPAEVDMVFCTHLHVDHVGWNTRLDNGSWVPTFPNARYLFSQADDDYYGSELERRAISVAQQNTYDDSVLPIIEAGLAHRIDGTEALGHGLTIHPTPGHSPGHMCLELNRAESRTMFTGDLLHSPLQVPLWHWRTNVCVDPDGACRSRKAMLEYCADNDLLVMPAHFPKPFGMHVERHGGELLPSFARARAMLEVLE